MQIAARPYVPGVVVGRLTYWWQQHRDLSDCIVVLRDVSAQEMLSLAARKPRGVIVLGHRPFSHILIYLFSQSIPAVMVGESDAPRDGQWCMLDGAHGLLNCCSNANDLPQANTQTSNPPTASPMLDGSVNTLDGVSITFEASVSDAKSALKARQSNAAAIGLVRSEFLGSVGERAPTIEEYVQAATELLQAAGELAITWRLLDIGGEKIFPWIKPSAALRDSLGGRGCRTYADPSIRPVIRSQIEALKQVDVHGQYSLVVPYVSSYDEFRRVRHDLESNLGADRFKIGAMLETPSACLAAVCISGDADFVSIGTNDLVQAFFGASRTFTETEGYIDPYAPPLLRFLANTSKQQTEKFASYRICGQLPLLPFVFEYLVGIGFRRFSLEPLALAGVAERCSRISASKLAIASEEAANQCDSGSVIRCLSSATGA